MSTGAGRTTCSYYYPGGDRILYATTHHWDPACPPSPDMSQGYVWALYPTFDIFMINADGTGLEQITHTDGFPMFSPDGKYLVFGSNRNESHPGNTNVFIAEWVEG